MRCTALRSQNSSRERRKTAQTAATDGRYHGVFGRSVIFFVHTCASADPEKGTPQCQPFQPFAKSCWHTPEIRTFQNACDGKTASGLQYHWWEMISVIETIKKMATWNLVVVSRIIGSSIHIIVMFLPQQGSPENYVCRYWNLRYRKRGKTRAVCATAGSSNSTCRYRYIEEDTTVLLSPAFGETGLGEFSHQNRRRKCSMLIPPCQHCQRVRHHCCMHASY